MYIYRYTPWDGLSRNDEDECKDVDVDTDSEPSIEVVWNHEPDDPYLRALRRLWKELAEDADWDPDFAAWVREKFVP
eukprot:tig00020684_g12853.t1